MCTQSSCKLIILHEPFKIYFSYRITQVSNFFIEHTHTHTHTHTYKNIYIYINK